MSEVKIESTTPQQQATYLKSLIQGAISQKVRLQMSIAYYEDNLKNISENVIDQNDLITTLKEDLGLI